MNADIRSALVDAERALEAGDRGGAIASFVEAGDAAVRYQLWRSATRAYRDALEVDVMAVQPVERIVALGARSRNAADWAAYREALAAHADWPHFGARQARISSDDRGARVECIGAGGVLRLAMPAADLVELAAEPQLDGMPLAMALLILRRALWPTEANATPRRVAVRFGVAAVELDETGAWGDRGV